MISFSRRGMTSMAYNCTNTNLCGIRRRTVLLGWQSLFTKVFTSPRPKCTQRNISTFLVLFSVYLFGGLECFGHSTPYVAHFVFLRDVCIRTLILVQVQSLSQVISLLLLVYGIQTGIENNTLLHCGKMKNLAKSYP